jgi:glycine/D-amino acid oxidase-like deaminating enzyme
MQDGLPDTIYARTVRESTRFPLLESAIEAETAVVGGGLAGLSTAMALAERGRAVALVEAKRVGFGASGRNGGFLSPSYPLGLDELAAALGVDGARELLRLARDAVAWARRLIAEHAIDCGPHPEGFLRIAWYDRPGEVERIVERANRVFGTRLSYLTKQEMAALVTSPFAHDGALESEGTQIQPLDYCRGLARAAASRGARIFEESPALSLTPQQGGWSVATPRGRIAAKHLVLAGGGYLGDLHRELAQATISVSTHIAATEPLGSERLARAIRCRHALHDTRRAGAYYRPLADTRLVWGGRLTLPWERGGNTAESIRRWIETTYPVLGPVQMAVGWSGYMSFGRSRMVQLGRLADGAWFANGFGGSGLGSTAVAGRLLAAGIAGESDEWRRFSPFALGWTGGPLGPLAARAVYTGYRLADWAQGRRGGLVKNLTAIGKARA